MKQWKCIQCGALFTTPTDAQPFPMTCGTCRASNPPSHAQFLRPTSAGYPSQGPRPPSPGAGMPAHRSPSPFAGSPGAGPGPIPLPGAPEQKVHTSSVTQMMKRTKTRTNLPAVPPPTASPPIDGRRRSTSVVGGIAQQAAEHRSQDHPPARRSKAGNKIMVIMFLGGVVAVIGIGVAIVLGMENPPPRKTLDTDPGANVTETGVPTSPTTPAVTTPPPPTPTAVTPPPGTLPPTPRVLTPYEEMQLALKNNPAPTPPTVTPPAPTPVPPPVPVNQPTERGNRLTRIDCAAENEAGGRWRRCAFAAADADTMLTWDAAAYNNQFLFFEWEEPQDFGSAVYLRVRYKFTGITRPNIALVAWVVGADATREFLPTPAAQQNQWLEFECKVVLGGKCTQFELRPDGPTEGASAISVDWVEIYAAKPIGAPTPAPTPAPGPVPAPGPAGAAITPEQSENMFRLVTSNDQPAVQALIAGNANYLTCRDKNDMSILHYAARRGHVALIQYLVKVGMAVDTGHRYGRTPLQQAAEFGEVEAVKTLLELGANINAPDDENRPPLYWALNNGHLPVIQELMKRGANANLPHSLTGQTSLHKAAQTGDLAQIQALLDGGANATLKDLNGKTPADIATAAQKPEAAALLAKATPAAAATGTGLLHLHGTAADAADGRRWQNGSVTAEADTTFATWTRNANQSQANLQYTHPTKDIVAIPAKVKIKLRIRLSGFSVPLQIKLYTHQGDQTEVPYGSFYYKPQVPVGQWADIEGEVTGPASPLRTIEFKFETKPQAGTKIDVDRLEILVP